MVQKSNWVLVKFRLKDYWITTWHHNLPWKFLYCSYNMYIQVYGMEEYLTKLTTNNHIQVTKCNNKLGVVTCRYEGLVREDRICNECDADVLWDEYHFLFQCNNEHIVRLCSQYILRYYSLTPYHTTKMVLKDLALFLRSVFSLLKWNDT